MPQEPERSHRISGLYHDALERHPEERRAFLDAECAGDAALRLEVESLLDRAPAAEGFLEEPVVFLAPGMHEAIVGRQVGPYRITALAGAGGMGEVYRARDMVLERDVALKILPPSLVADAERQARFGREARALAALSHPHIGAIYGLEAIDGSTALVLEFVEGPTLASRLRHGALPVAQALAVASDVADALAAAHDHHIVHRDVKPSNVVLQGWPAGARHVSGVPRAKVIDFGLARLVADEDAQPEASDQASATREGRLLGSPPYMSPEQAQGHPVDRRTDVWAFGCVLYEMLTGRAAFDGTTAADTLARILERDPDWTALPKATPEGIRRLLRHCLEKDAGRRLRDLGDARLEIEEARAAPPPVTGTRRWIAWAAAAIVGALVVAGGLAYLGRTTPERPTVAFTIAAPTNAVTRMPLDPFATISPDGRRIAFTLRSPDAPGELWVRSLDAFDDARVVPGTRGAFIPFWSPDGTEIAFFDASEGQLKAVRHEGGPVRVLCAAAAPLGGTWNRDGTILFSTATSSAYEPTSVPVAGLHRVAAAGGGSTPLATRAVAQDGMPVSRRYGTRESGPRFLPDGRHFLYLDRDSRSIHVSALDSDTSTPVVRSDSQGIYADPGYLLFVRDGALLAQAFDARRLELRGEAVRIAENIRFSADLGGAVFSVSETGVLVYSTGLSVGPARAQWLDRAGQTLETFDLPTVRSARLSPDGRRLAYDRPAAGEQADLWVLDLERQTNVRLTAGPADEKTPVWSPDGGHVAYVSNEQGVYNLYRIAATGAGPSELVFESGDEKVVADWSSDGRYLAFSAFTPETRDDVWLLDRQSGPRAIRLLSTAASEQQPRFSPNGQWLAYTSNQTGASEVYVQRLPSGAPVPVSVGGGWEPLWRHDGRELFFVSSDNWLMTVAVDVSADADPIVRGKGPERLFELPDHCGPTRCLEVSVDRAGRFLVVTADTPTELMRVVVNWNAALGGQGEARR